ncbi:pentatricopeptide repeat-containing protein [Carex littledalei]|uniref:Pentatricopeptide repeat-containing protein n=1 Tax=Carex littledalei TaxID=544730 RepID=A0A833QMK8_9POAL|nr:pentatricopeptide repeat-containing protein [Carex littledalei]
MAFILSSACRRRSSRHHLRHLFSTSTTTAGAETPSPLPIVTDSIFCHESDPTRFISTLFSFPDRTCARYAADLALRRLSLSLNFTSRSDLLDSFLPLASSEQDFASLLISYGSAILPKKALSAFSHRLATGGPLSVSTLSFNALLSAFIRSRRHQAVPDLFVSICEEHSISPDVVSYGLLVRAFFLSNRPTDAFATLKQISDEQGIVMTDQIYRLLLVSLHGHGKTEEANQLWNEMVSNGVQPDCTAYNVKAVFVRMIV